MSNILVENRPSQTERIREQYQFLKESIDSLMDAKDPELSLFYKVLQLRLTSLFATIEKINDTRMNRVLSRELASGLEDDLEIIRKTLRKIDMEGLKEAKKYFDTHTFYKST